ncbi:hypothetical protein GCM10010278_82830 [Streptomyces melanogenes]|nr:hypothetical protein GCM10010278_82830 [Streptomyces melanogenes]
MTSHPHCPLCMARAHTAGHPLPEEPEAESPLSPTAVLTGCAIALLAVAAWSLIMWFLYRAFG